MLKLLEYAILCFLLYIIYVLFVIRRKKKLKQFRNSIFVKYLEKVYHLDIENISIQKLAHIVAIVNAGIITATLYVTSITDHIVFKMLLAFASLIPMEIICYHIIGKCYQKKS